MPADRLLEVCRTDRLVLGFPQMHQHLGELFRDLPPRLPPRVQVGLEGAGHEVVGERRSVGDALGVGTF